jgi:Domain of unknown function (DUF5664)
MKDKRTKQQKAATASKANKVRMDLLDPRALKGLARVIQFGADKHGERAWEKHPMKWSTPYAALLRHALAFWEGEDMDPEMMLFHADAMQANAHFLSKYVREGIGEDDRPSNEVD